MPAATDTIGSLVIDLRANVAQLQVDMAQVKDIVTKSSAQMSSQMKSDFAETRQVLALLRDDFGISVPREIRATIASSELARTALLGLKDAIVGIALVNIGIEAFTKISDYIQKADQAAIEEAKHTADIATAARDTVDATIKRKEALELIGKGEEDRAALQKKFFEDELQRSKTRLSSLQAQIAAKTALVALDVLAAGDPQGAAMTNTPIDTQQDQEDARSKGMKDLGDLVQKLKPQIDAAQKAIDEALAGSKTNDLQLADFEKGLALSRLKNETDLALKDVELKQDTIQKEFAAGQIGIDQELIALRTAATEKYNIKLAELQSTLDILEQDPSRNKEKIEQVQTELQLLWKDYEKSLTDIKAQGVADRKKLIDEQAKLEADAAKNLIASNKDHGILPVDLANFGGGTPQLNPDIMGAAVQRFAGNFKDAAAQGKLLEQAMDDLLTPMDKFRVEQQEIELLKEKFKDYPAVIKALDVELLKANPDFQKLMAASAEFGKDLSTELDNLIVKGGDFHTFLVNIAKDIEEIALKALLLKPLEDFFSGGKSGTGGIFGGLASLFGGLGGGASAGAAGSSVGGGLAGLFSGLGFADGGNPPTGQFSLVGEDGPELFMPSSSGTIVPNGAFGGGGNTTIYIDAKGAAPGSEAAIMRGMQKALEQTRQRSVASAIDYQRRR